MPDFRAQFREPPGPKFDHVYMGGTAMSCGQRPSLPKRHRWGPWREVTYHSGAVGWERICQTCALVSDTEWTKPRTARMAARCNRVDDFGRVGFAETGSTRFAPEVASRLRPAGNDPARKWRDRWLCFDKGRAQGHASTNSTEG